MSSQRKLAKKSVSQNTTMIMTEEILHTYGAAWRAYHPSRTYLSLGVTEAEAIGNLLLDAPQLFPSIEITRRT